MEDPAKVVPGDKPYGKPDALRCEILHGPFERSIRAGKFLEPHVVLKITAHIGEGEYRASFIRPADVTIVGRKFVFNGSYYSEAEIDQLWKQGRGVEHRKNGDAGFVLLKFDYHRIANPGTHSLVVNVDYLDPEEQQWYGVLSIPLEPIRVYEGGPMGL